MMTIDEAIEKHRKIAEMYRCEYECDCDYYGKDFIDDYADELDYIKNMHEHEQLVDWLEELKMYKEVGTVEGYKSAIEGYNEEYIIRKSNKQYNKAIDDFAILIKDTLNHDWATTKISEQRYNRLFDKCNEIAKQLKE